MRFGKLLAEDSPDSLLERLVIIFWKYEMCLKFNDYIRLQLLQEQPGRCFPGAVPAGRGHGDGKGRAIVKLY